MEMIVKRRKMERLTDLIGGEDNEYCTYVANEIQVLNKLGKLEDIMEKYSIESVEELETRLCDRDTWKRACELACDWYAKIRVCAECICGDAEECGDCLNGIVKHYYAQAQKEMIK